MHSNEDQTNGTAEGGTVYRLIRRVVDVKPEEVAALFLACAYYFLLLTSYYIMRPIRDSMGVVGGVRNLPWLFTGTLLGMMLANPIYSAVVARLPRLKFIAVTYRFFMLCMLTFFALLHLSSTETSVWIGRVFFIWVSVFNLFVVSVFWSFLADTFVSEQGKRLFPFIALGGTIGALLGSSITAFFAELVGPTNLLLISIAFLETAVWCARFLARHSPEAALKPMAQAAKARGPAAAAAPGRGEEVIGGSAIAGVGHVLRSPYLLGICAFMLLYTIGSTFLYFQQSTIADATFSDDAQLTAFFARVDMLTQLATIVFQAYLTARFMKWAGVAATLAVLPLISVLGFLAVGIAPVLATVVAFQVLRRAGEYGIARPAREVLYTVIPREDKYKAKNFIDTFVYRGGDQIGAWSFAAMTALGLGVSGIGFVGAPLAAIWLIVGIWLGRRQKQLAARTTQQDTRVAGEPVPA